VVAGSRAPSCRTRNGAGKRPPATAPIEAVTLAPGFEAGVRLLQGVRRPSTVKSYDQKWLNFENFTTQV
jgi:hypothetical protein